MSENFRTEFRAVIRERLLLELSDLTKLIWLSQHAMSRPFGSPEMLLKDLIPLSEKLELRARMVRAMVSQWELSEQKDLGEPCALCGKTTCNQGCLH